MRHASWILMFFLWSVPTMASFEFPKGLNASERVKTMEVFGLGTAPKFLSNAYPLGGHHGLEISTSVETFDTDAIGSLGEGSTNTGSIYYPKITIGKGLFAESDIFFNFIPFNQVTKFSRYGLQFRRSLFRLTEIPLNASLVLHGNSSNIDDLLITRTLGFDLSFSTMFDPFSLIVAIGYASTTGSFASSLVDDSVAVTSRKSSAESLHGSVGFIYRPGLFFVGLSMDYYKQWVGTLKFGFFI